MKNSFVNGDNDEPTFSKQSFGGKSALKDFPRRTQNNLHEKRRVWRNEYPRL